MPAFVFAQSKPNVIIILADDLGPYDLSSQGHPSYDTPIIDSLRANGAVFSRFYVSPNCTPTRASLMSSKYPHRLDLHTSVIWPPENRSLPTNETTLAQRLKNAGYDTGIFGKWHLGHAQPEYLPHARGFDRHYGFATGASGYYNKLHWYGGYSYISDGLLNANNSVYLDTDITSECINFIESSAQDATKPFFAYLAFWGPHTPLALSRELTVEQLDVEVGRVWQKIKDLGIEENTIIAFSTDNGTNLSSDPNNPLRNYKGYITEGGILANLSWYHKGTVAAGTQIDSVCGMIDVGATICDIINEPINELDSIDGQSFGALLNYNDCFTWIEDRKYIGHYLPGRTWAVIQGKYKLINNPDSDIRSDAALSESLFLYNVETDSAETTDLKATYPNLVTSLRQPIDSSNAALYNWSNAGPNGWTLPEFWAIPSWFYSNNNVYKKD